MNPSHNKYMDRQLDVLTRIIALETKLASTIEKLDSAIDTVVEKQDELNQLYQGSNITPSLLSRIISLEEFKRAVFWSVGVLYTALIGILVTLIARKL